MPENSLGCIYQEAQDLQNKVEGSSDGWEGQVKERFFSKRVEPLKRNAFTFHSHAAQYVQNMRKRLKEIDEYWNRIKHF